MLELFFLLLIIFGFVAGSGFLYLLLQRLSKRVDSGDEGPSMALLREEVESLAGRLERVEEELDFYKRLKAPDDSAIPAELPPPENPGQ